MHDRIVFHVDMDAFFAAVEERDNIRFQGRPIVVGADPMGGKGRGVVSTANYQAREYGIRSATPISTAWKLSEAASAKGKSPVLFLKVDMQKYNKVSRAIMGYLKEEADIFEQASIDEAYLDMSTATRVKISTRAWWRAEQLAMKIKKTIKKYQNLTASIGVGPNKLIAKIASDEQKPDGLTIIPPEKVRGFLDPRPVDTVPGIGPKTKKRLEEMKIYTLKDLRRSDLDSLRKEFGKRAFEWQQKARGQDESPVAASKGRKSLGKQSTFQKDTLDPNKLMGKLKELVSDVLGQMKEQEIKAKTFTVVVRFEDFETRTKSESVEVKTADEKEVRSLALNLLLPFMDNRENLRRKKIRLIGFRAENLSQRYEEL